ncbi:MAG: hypothetical protein USCAAHI_00078 [Beijerinckiaceae bacterium]|nr:MAG: hypothetical protein USCAAHI_00078 [Beijerinckiaceae bacterium]
MTKGAVFAIAFGAGIALRFGGFEPCPGWFEFSEAISSIRPLEPIFTHGGSPSAHRFSSERIFHREIPGQ